MAWRVLQVGVAVSFGVAALALQSGLPFHMWLTFIISSLFVLGFLARRKLTILVGAAAWFVEGAWEYALRSMMSPQEYADFNIRLDLLIVIPIVVVGSAVAGFALAAPPSSAEAAVAEG